MIGPDLATASLSIPPLAASAHMDQCVARSAGRSVHVCRNPSATVPGGSDGFPYGLRRHTYARRPSARNRATKRRDRVRTNLADEAEATKARERRAAVADHEFRDRHAAAPLGSPGTDHLSGSSQMTESLIDRLRRCVGSP